jgi:mannose-1-phosphate guanylyltransferase
MFYAVIMAGGSGTRLWPLSRNVTPKQSLRLVGTRTMFQHAVDRLAPLFPAEQIFVVTRADHVSILKEQAPEIPPGNFIVEPEGRGTAPAIGLAAIHLKHRDPDAVMAVLTADHFITDTDSFRQVLVVAEAISRRGYLVTLGIQPDSPSTGYGYIEFGPALEGSGKFDAFRICRFIEKPDLDEAMKMVASKHFVWNSGMFIWQVDQILAEFDRQMPDFSDSLSELNPLLDTNEYEAHLARLWPKVTKQTIDYGIMEGAKKAAVIPVCMGWSDVGSWGSLFDLMPLDESRNIWVGPVVSIDTSSTLAFGGKRLIATLGVENLIIIDSDDALLVCGRDRVQDVRLIVEQLKISGFSQWL